MFTKTNSLQCIHKSISGTSTWTSLLDQDGKSSANE